MTELELDDTDQLAGSAESPPTAHKTLLERKSLSADALLHGAYYSGFLDDTATVARWNDKKRRFVMWERKTWAPKIRAVLHVGNPGAGARFAPLFRLESAGGYEVSDFALETTR